MKHPERIVDFVTDWKLQLAMAAATTRLSVVTWQSVARACAEVKEQETTGQKVLKGVWDCGMAAVAAVISQLIAAAGAVAALTTAAPLLREWLQAHARRSLEDMDLHAREALPHLAPVFGVEVRHLGHWNDTVTPSMMRKRDAGHVGPEGLSRPVFGATLYGRDFHFSLLDHDEEENSFTFRFGDGSDSDGQGLSARAERNWFTEGGIDYKYISPHNLPPPEGMDDLDKKDDLFAWIYYQLTCAMRANGYDYPKSDTNAMYIQLYDRGQSGTRIAANIAAFGPDGHSGLDELGDFRGSIDMDEKCVVQDNNPFYGEWLYGPW